MENNKFVEVELKFPILNPKESIDKISSISGPSIKTDYQKDIYYIPKHRDFIKQNPISEWLRIRKTKERVTLNYKNWHVKDRPKVVSADEFETTIDNVEALEKIFSSLDIKELIAVEKTRNIWRYDKAEIAIDEVAHLGFFIEIEAKGEFESIESAKDYLYKVLKELNVKVGEQDFKGYPFLLLEKKGLI